MVAEGYAPRVSSPVSGRASAKPNMICGRPRASSICSKSFRMEERNCRVEGEIGIAGHNQQLEAARYKAEEEELAYIRRQIEHCIVRAPQNGIAIHSMRGFWRRTRLQPGVRVYENQELFKLPDLSQMEVEVSVNESMGPRVEVGMRAEIQVASLGERSLPGRVFSITPLSSVNDKEWDERVRHFIVRVRLDVTPSRLLLMSAVVKFGTGRVLDRWSYPLRP